MSVEESVAQDFSSEPSVSSKKTRYKDRIIKKIAMETKAPSKDSKNGQSVSDLNQTIKELEAALNDANQIRSAVDTGWASIEFQPDGIILDTNENWEKTLGYEKTDMVGQHHRMFCDDEYASSAEYKKFWKDLAKGVVQSGEFQRLKNGGEEFWINASYTPIIDDKGKVSKVIKIATDITQMVSDRVQGEAIKAAVDAGWASIEFEPDGTILDVNENWINTLGYDKSEMVGQHHRIFCDKAYASSAEYKQFWKDLANGKVKSGEFQRFKNGGEELWINASYAPVKDAEGQVFKVVKIAADITDIKVPILRVKDIITNMAEGDLTHRFDLQSEGYVGEMGDALNVALDNMNNLLGDINESSTLIATSSEQMLTKSDQMQGTTQEVASAIGQMAEGVQDQARQIDDSSKLIDEVRTSAEKMGEQSQTINDAAKKGQVNAKKGLDTVKKVVDSMSQIQDAANVTSESIEVLTERSEEIARTLNVITDIAGQTNLLALNAAIEAARAGDAGRGFAVVAEEIRKLAEDSRTSAGDIEKVIKAVEKDISQAGKAIDEMGNSVKAGNGASKEAETVFIEIDESIIETLGLSEEVLKATEVQKMSMDETVKNIEKIVTVSEETSSGTEEIATSSKDLSDGMNEFNSSSKGLADIANQLQEGVSKFKLRTV
ncbi:MAG: methyl-accepting chemotaxis protein [Reichenbachiella sp.]|uniref:methyl-accepting chemotaxis protein n=1 Tax=Reichenbachiella sp. TaxID=2184521 RepID=UPI003262F849